MNNFNKISSKFISLIFGLFMIFCELEGVSAVTKTIKITFVGDFASGKTALRCRLSKQPFDFSKRVITEKSSCMVEVIDYDESTKLACQMWDTSGKETVKEQILNMRVKNSEFVVITVDLSEKRIKSGYDNIVSQAMNEWYPLIREKSPTSKIILTGTKLDKVVDQDYIEKIERCMEATKDLNFNRLEYLLTSSRTNDGIDDFFDIIRRNVDISRAELLYNVSEGAEDDVTAIYLMCNRCHKKYRETSDINNKFYNYCSTNCYNEAHKITCKYKNCTNKFLPKTAGDKYCSIGCEERDKSPCNLV